MINAQPSLPSSVYENIDYWAVLIICALLAIIGTLLGIVLHNQRRSRVSADSTLHQVKNSHELNLRDDLDQKFAVVNATLATHGRDIGGMRSEIRQMRQEFSDDTEDTRERVRFLERSKRAPRRPTQKKETP